MTALTDDEVERIRHAAHQGHTYRGLAHRFGVHRSTIEKAVNGTHHNDVAGPVRRFGRWWTSVADAPNAPPISLRPDRHPRLAGFGPFCSVCGRTNDLKPAGHGDMLCPRHRP